MPQAYSTRLMLMVQMLGNNGKRCGEEPLVTRPYIGATLKEISYNCTQNYEMNDARIKDSII